ncbi:MAG: hypothetical protein ACM3X7_10595 [Solirubrobacterales bacterium]
MSFKDKLTQYYTKSYLKKYGDRITQVQGNVVSVKITEKSILGIFHKITVSILVRPDRSKTIVQCIYEKKKWFKKPEFIPISQGNLLLVQGLKGKKTKDGKPSKESREKVSVLNIRNLTTKKDLVPIEGNVPKVQRQVQRFK